MFARRRADELVVHSQYLREIVLQNLPGIRGKVSVIPHIQIGEEPSSAASKSGRAPGSVLRTYLGI